MYNGKEISRDILDRLHTEAAIVGTQNKCHDFKWVEVTSDPCDESIIIYKAITEDRLYDPECNPAILVDFETRKGIPTKMTLHGVEFRTRFRFLFTLEKAYDIIDTFGLSSFRPIGNDFYRTSSSNLIGSNHPLKKMVDKVEEAIGQSLTN